MTEGAEGTEGTQEAEGSQGAEGTTETEGTSTESTESEQDWKARARQWEREAKKAKAEAEKLAPKAAEYDKLDAASKTETERAQAAATAAEERAAAMQGRIAAAEIKAALTGIVPDPAAVVEDLNLDRFVTAEGEIDAAAVTALKEKYATFAPAGDGPRTPAPTPGQGANTQPRAGQLTREALKNMSPAEIVKAQSEGLLNDVLGVK